MPSDGQRLLSEMRELQELKATDCGLLEMLNPVGTDPGGPGLAIESSNALKRPQSGLTRNLDRGNAVKRLN